MKELKLKPEFDHADEGNYVLDYQKPCIERIVAACAEKGFNIQERTAICAWEHYSEVYHASWLDTKSSYGDDIFASIEPFLEPK